MGMIRHSFAGLPQYARMCAKAPARARYYSMRWRTVSRFLEAIRSASPHERWAGRQNPRASICGEFDPQRAGITHETEAAYIRVRIKTESVLLAAEGGPSLTARHLIVGAVRTALSRLSRYLALGLDPLVTRGCRPSGVGLREFRCRRLGPHLQF